MKEEQSKFVSMSYAVRFVHPVVICIPMGVGGYNSREDFRHFLSICLFVLLFEYFSVYLSVCSSVGVCPLVFLPSNFSQSFGLI